MYQYALEKLKKDLEEQQILKNRKKEELEQITEKLESIEDYDKLLYEQFFTKYITGALLIAGTTCGIFSISLFISFTKNAIIASLGCSMVTFGVFAFSLKGIKNIHTRTKKIKSLKISGVKKFKKQQKDLEHKKFGLEKEMREIQNQMDKIIKILEHIYFVKETANDIFYQADTQEEYENAMKQNCLLMWTEFLNEKIDYSKIQLDEGNRVCKKFCVNDNLSV